MILNYKGSTQFDTGYYLCLYRPGMSDEEIQEVNEQTRLASTPPTQIQLRINELAKTQVVTHD